MRELAKYGLVVAVYIAIGLSTKRLLTWTNGPLFMLLALELVPAGWRRMRRAEHGR